ncbi:MAG: hypothetical protein ACD_76C00042G0013 [uncultured bacterium]|nr:MAG: hypothetical protein ACD_76C00042G0013 [uncultured bacterium]
MSNDEKLHVMRHSAAHVLAAAVQELYPDSKFGVGPVIEGGFYYDILLNKTLSDDDLPALEKKMSEIIARKDDFVREEMTIDDAIVLFDKLGQQFKVELLKDLKEKGTTSVREEEHADVDSSNLNVASIYKTGAFTDLCRGPHVKNTSEIKAFKLWKISGAYWRGNEKNPQMQRVYGLAFETKKDLDEYLAMLEEAKKRDHRKLGEELDLFTFSPLVGSGLPLFTEKGTAIRRTLEQFIWSLMKPYGYTRVWIPHMAKTDLYKTSGHWDKFADDIFHVSSKKSEEEFVLKPMNCPHHTQIYASRPRSYRELPIRMSEVTTVYRDENTGQLQGLSRVRSITQDDAHVFCRPDQVETEVRALYDIIQKFYAAFEMPLTVSLSLRDRAHPEKYLGSDDVWKKAESALRDVLTSLGLEFSEQEGEAAFYGPKIDFQAKDAIGRQWQLATIQLDFNLPERFNLEYTDENGEKQRPVMVHRAVLGSVERFISVLIEHYAGAFPLWLAPVQVRLATVSRDHTVFARELYNELLASDIRAELDDSDETVGKKIRNASAQKIPWTIVIGEKESSGGDFQIRVFGSEDPLVMQKNAMIEELKKRVV